MPKATLLNKPAANPNLWMLEPEAIFLNHGSFGACPKAVLDYQQEIRNRMEARPVQFFVRNLEELLDQARIETARFLHAKPGNLVFVANATAGVNTVLRSLRFNPGDELLVTNHEYNACRNALDYAGTVWKARTVVTDIPFPLQSEDQILDVILRHVSPRTRLALIDHVTSQTGLVLPIERIVRELDKKGIDVLVDGAHAPGMLPLDLRKLNAAYYTGNCHKWICSPKVAGILYVRDDLKDLIRPLSISHGANSPRKDRSRFLIEFGWTGTWDPSAMLSVPKAIRYMGSLLTGGWPEVMRRNRELAMRARRVLCEQLDIELPCPDQLIGSLAALPLPDATKVQMIKSPLYMDPIQDWLWEKSKIEVPVIPWPAPPKRLLRISAQLYNSLPQYERLAELLHERFRRRKRN